MSDQTNPNDGGSAGEVKDLLPAEQRLSQDDISAIMDFDPFGPSDAGTEAKPEGGAETEPKAPPSEREPAAEAAAPAAPTPEPKPEPQKDEAAELRQKLEEQNQLIQRLLAKEAEPKPTPKAEPEGPKAPEAPRYAFQLPPQLTQALGSEDETVRAQGTNILVNSIMNQLHIDFSKMLDERLKAVVSEMPAVVTQQVSQRQTVETMTRDLAGAYPNVGGNETLRDLAFRAIQTEAEIRRTAGYPVQWGRDIMDAGIARLESQLGIPLRMASPTAAAPAAPTGRAPAKSQFAGGGNAGRGGNGKADGRFGADLLDF